MATTLLVPTPRLTFRLRTIPTIDLSQPVFGTGRLDMITRAARCWPAGATAFHLNPGLPTYFIQTPKKVWMIWAGRPGPSQCRADAGSR